MRPALVVKLNPVTDDSIGMLQGLKPLTMNTLLFQGSDYTLDHPILLRAVGRDALLLQTVASDQGCEASAGKDQAILSERSKKGCRTLTRVPDLAIKACSRAASAVLALPERDRCQPENSRV